MLRANHPRRLAAWVLVSFLLGPLAEARQEAPARPGGRLAVVELSTPPTMIGLGAQVLQQVQTAARKQGFTVVPAEDVEQALGRKPYEELQKCGGEPTCVAGRLSRMGVDHAVVGALSRDEKSYLLKLYLIDVKQGALVSSVDRSVLIASRRFKDDAAQAIPRMLRGEREATGKLVVTTNVQDVEVWIDGEPRGRTPLELELKPGKYEVRLERKSYLPIRRLVDVDANQVNTPELRMLREPGAAPEEKLVPALVAKKAATTESAFRIPVPAWVALGAGAAAGATGIYFGTSAQRIERELKDGFDAQGGLYSGTRARALEGRQHALTANILFGVAGAAVVTGAVLTLLDPGDDANVSVAPVAGPSGAGVQLGGRF
ncbi:MAG: PEGA domain-containing protein [Myxococcaceae bacterium]